MRVTGRISTTTLTNDPHGARLQDHPVRGGRVLLRVGGERFLFQVRDGGPANGRKAPGADAAENRSRDWWAGYIAYPAFPGFSSTGSSAATK